MKRLILILAAWTGSQALAQSTAANEAWQKLAVLKPELHAIVAKEDVIDLTDPLQPDQPVSIKARSYHFKQVDGEAGVRKNLANFGRYLSLRRADGGSLGTTAADLLKEYRGRRVFVQTFITRSYFALAQTARDRSIQCALFQRSERERQKLGPLLQSFLAAGARVDEGSLPTSKQLDKGLLPASMADRAFLDFLAETLDARDNGGAAVEAGMEVPLAGIISTLNQNCALVSINNRATLLARIREKTAARLLAHIVGKVDEFRGTVNAATADLAAMMRALGSPGTDPAALYGTIFVKDASVGEVSFRDAISNAKTNFDLAYTDGLGFAGSMQRLREFYQRNKCKKDDRGGVSCEAASYPLLDTLAQRIAGCVDQGGCAQPQPGSIPAQFKALDQLIGSGGGPTFQDSFRRLLAGESADIDALNARYIAALRKRDAFQDFDAFKASNEAVSASMTALTKRLMNL